MTKNPFSAVLAVGGSDALTFLQGIVSCNLETLKPNSAAYGLLLAPQGRLLFDFLVMAVPESLNTELTGGYILFCTPAGRLELAKTLYRYKLGKDVFFEDWSDNYLVAPLKDTAPEGTLLVMDDPRLPNMPRLAFLPPETWQKHPDFFYTIEEFRAIKVNRCLPTVQNDMLADSKLYPADMGLDLIGAIDFNKGCYVGQEVVARMRHRGQRRKLPVTVSWSCTEHRGLIGSLSNAQGQEVSAITSIVHQGEVCKGIAIINIDTLSTPVFVEGVPASLTPPDWLPL